MYATTERAMQLIRGRKFSDPVDLLDSILDHAERIGAFDQIAIIEEPFPEEQEIDISDIPIRIAADESAHTDANALKRIEMGYKAIAFKAIEYNP